MKVVSVKFDERILSEMDKSLGFHNFNSRTEFIREAIRDKLFELKKERAFLEFLKLKGASSIKTSVVDNLKTKKKVDKELLEVLEARFKS